MEDCMRVRTAGGSSIPPGMGSGQRGGKSLRTTR